MAILDLQKVGFEVDGKELLKDITLQVQAGDWLTIEGPSGSGKSLLLKLIASLLTPTTGNIYFNGQNQATFNKVDYRKQISYCFQQPSLFGQTVKDNLVFPFIIRNIAFDEQRAITALDNVDLPKEFLEKEIKTLSGGQKQRVALIRNLLFPPKVLLLDEITTGLDTQTKDIMNHLLVGYQNEGMTVLSVTHDEREISEADHLIRIVAGRMAESHE
ncbi:ATP-binding cassette domain-containing protein [Weissella paramesenteroides]|uniref:ABC transporter ATP-binding protein n=1 Tax=Weissella paramesenteroides TaxID=1249 RepID=UPI00123C638B|nr:ATP-binding cassette domain-containing protein [Weissella paramesenteroides]KAA8440362.1 ATP-binding cassette domain-containing protein [Weissella paramesenteroides]KAA8440642.1 ATP-binding cassette domain-containing protein [Weissella paramesenteroides]KAA8440737.1 ATP-binding cassette domain-containing protein [Weissella paramesenteroides]KAA8445649.1 ATP-binding cassette domain-containing protein [Weissella paramesenteroides]KAA8448541.1 ATP-binding cassette domain-containing protein [We